MLNIIFWGEDSFSAVVLQSLIDVGHHVKMVISPYYENIIYKRLELICNRNNILFRRFQDVNSDEVYELLSEIRPDLCVIAHFEKLIKPRLLKIPNLGFINLHPSLLPAYRGMAPQHWPIINGECETGITVHYVDEGVDTGDIVLQERITLTSNMYVSDLQNEWLRMYRYVMVQAIERICTGNLCQVQINSGGSYYGRLKPEQCRIDIEGNKEDAYNLIRGVSMPYFGARYKEMIIWRAHPADEEINSAFSEKYKENGIYKDEQIGIFLKFTDGILLIDKYKSY